MPQTFKPSIRSANSADIPAMSRIRLSVTENTLSDPSRVTRQMYEDYLEQSGRGWVAENDGDLVAFCYADTLNGSIWALFVEPAHEGKGLGRLLLELAADCLFETGHDCIRLTTGANTRADRFYAAQGWTRTPVGSTDVQFSLTSPRKVTAYYERIGRFIYSSHRLGINQADIHAWMANDLGVPAPSPDDSSAAAELRSAFFAKYPRDDEFQAHYARFLEKLKARAS